MFVALLLLTHLVVLLLTAWLSPTGATPAPWWLSSMDASSKASASVVKKKKNGYQWLFWLSSWMVSYRIDLSSWICSSETAAAEEKDHGVPDGQPLCWEKLLHQLVNIFCMSKRTSQRASSSTQKSNNSTTGQTKWNNDTKELEIGMQQTRHIRSLLTAPRPA